MRPHTTSRRFPHALAVCATILASALATVSAQSSRVESGVTSLSGFDFYWETRLDPPTPPLADSLRMIVLTSGDGTVHRVMLDRTQKVFFGYDARVEVREATGTYLVTFAPLSVTPELSAILGDASAWTLLPAPRFPDPRTIRSGDVLELTLLTNSTWGQKVTEYVTVQDPQREGFDTSRREFAFAVGAPRDFSAADVELRLEEPLVRWRGQSVTGGRIVNTMTTRRAAGETSGAIVWIYVPGRGRFLLSLIPRGTFSRAGTVRGTSLVFTAAGNTYNVTSAARIAPGQAAFNLYVLHQPGWKPAYANANLDTVHIGAADRVEYLVP